MWRYLVTGVAAIALLSCDDCRSNRGYNCVERYDPFWGYYSDCSPAGGVCHDDHASCWGGDCGGGTTTAPTCARNSDCERGQYCSVGQCVSIGASGGAANGSGGAPHGSGGASHGSGGASSGGASSLDGSAPRSSGGASSVDGGASSGDSGASGGKGGGGEVGGGSGANSSGGNSAEGGTTGAGGHAGTTGGGTSGANGSGGANGTGGASGGGRIPRLDFSCVRDTQCGAGECDAGICYVACESDSDCGTGDRCSVETGRRLCMPDPNPAVRCDESAICTTKQTCVNGTCHDPCAVDDDCENLQDRCTSGLCFPDRRPIDECVLNVECAADLVCLNGRCVSFGGD